MAKKGKDQHAGESAGPRSANEAPVRTPATPTGTAPEVAVSKGSGAAAVARPAGRGGLLVESVEAVRGVLPTSRVPVYLAGSALLVVGLVDPPAAIGAGLAYEALRRWEPQHAR